MPPTSVDLLREAGYSIDEARQDLYRAHGAAAESHVALVAYDLLGLLSIALSTVFDIAEEEELGGQPPPPLKLA